MLRQLKEQGLVADMSDPVSKYEPRFKIRSSGFSGEPTLEQLSSNMAGLPRNVPCLNPLCAQGFPNVTSDDQVSRE